MTSYYANGVKLQGGEAEADLLRSQGFAVSTSAPAEDTSTGKKQTGADDTGTPSGATASK